jgi:hypothetical protein
MYGNQRPEFSQCAYWRTLHQEHFLAKRRLQDSISAFFMFVICYCNIQNSNWSKLMRKFESDVLLCCLTVTN